MLVVFRECIPVPITVCLAAHTPAPGNTARWQCVPTSTYRVQRLTITLVGSSESFQDGAVVQPACCIRPRALSFIIPACIGPQTNITAACCRVVQLIALVLERSVLTIRSVVCFTMADVVGQHSNVNPCCWMPVGIVVPLLWALVTTAIALRVLARVDSRAVAEGTVAKSLVSREEACHEQVQSPYMCACTCISNTKVTIHVCMYLY